MKKSYRTLSFFSNLKYSFAFSLQTKRWKIFVSIMVSVIAIFTGVFFAIKYNKSETLSSLQEISIDNFKSGFTGSSSAFMSRTVSILINLLFLFLFSLSKFMFPLAQILFAYRGYLFGLNFALIFIMYGFGGILTSVVVILPCQLLLIFFMIVFYLFMSELNSKSKCYYTGNKFLTVLLCVIFFILLNLVETLFLYLLNGRVIMVI